MTEMMKKKLEGKKGFTLVELLIVVAIIAILVAVSIPVYSNYTENVAKGVDQANERDAVGLATTAALTADDTTLTWTGGEAGAPGATGTGYYTVTNNKGTLVKDGSTATAYGKCKDHNGCIVKVTVTNGKATTEWVKPTALTTPVGSTHLS